MQSFKVYSIKSGLATDYVFILDDGRFIYIYEALQRITCDGTEKTFFRAQEDGNRLLEPDSKGYKTAVEKYKGYMKAFDFDVE